MTKRLAAHIGSGGRRGMTGRPGSRKEAGQTMKSRNGLLPVAMIVTALALGACMPRASAQELPDAVSAGDLAAVRSIVEKDPGIVNVPDAGGETILFTAIASRQSALIEYFLAQGADVNARNRTHVTPLLVACRRGLPLEIVQLLVEKGADVNAASKYQGRPLDWALENGDEPAVRYLTAKGAVPTPPDFETVELSDHLHRVAFAWGMRNNLIVMDGTDGILVIDTGFNKRSLDAFKTIVAGLARGDVKYVINTHSHWDHVAGNAILAPSEAAVIGLGRLDGRDLEDVLTKSSRSLVGRSGQTLPAPYLLAFNGEDIELIPYPDLHSEADLLVHFPKSGVVCMGDLLLSQSCPAVRGKWADYLDLLDKVLDVFPPGTTFVGGHGRDLKSAELQKYRDDLAEMVAIVRREYAAGRTAENMIDADVLRAFKPDYSQLEWLGPDFWITTVARSLATGQPE